MKFIIRAASPLLTRAALAIGAHWANDFVGWMIRVATVAPNFNAELEAAGVVKDTTKTKILRGMGQKQFEDVISSPMYRSPVKPYNYDAPIINESGTMTPGQIGRAGEAYVELIRTNRVQGTAGSYSQELMSIPGRSELRAYDLVYEANGVTYYLEAKTGRQGLSEALSQQILGDKELILDGRKVVWIFVASSSGIGPTPALRRALEEALIPFEVHWPR